MTIQIDSANPDLNRLYTPPGSPNTNCKAIPTPVAGNNTRVIEEGCNNVKSTVNLNAGNNDSKIASSYKSEKSKPKYTKKGLSQNCRKKRWPKQPMCWN